MADAPAVHQLGATAVVLKPSLGADVRDAAAADFYPALDRDYDDFKGCSLISQHSFSAAWGVWEMHPAGEEVVTLLSGDTDIVLRVGGEDKVVRLKIPGQYVIVPKGVWHTAKPHAPTTMLFVTPGEGTQNEAEPPA